MIGLDAEADFWNTYVLPKKTPPVDGHSATSEAIKQLFDTDDGDNNAKLIRLVRDVPYEKRTARFVSVITMVYPDGRTIVAKGTVEGHLVLEARGGGGFGYDPLFVPEGYDKTFGELGPEVKNTISHRARALEELHRKLENSIE